MKRGEIWLADFPPPIKRRPIVLISRNQAYSILESFVAAIVTSTIRKIPCEVILGKENGLDRPCVANCDNIYTIPKSRLIKRLGQLTSEQERQLNEAISFSLEL